MPPPEPGTEPPILLAEPPVVEHPEEFAPTPVVVKPEHPYPMIEARALATLTFPLSSSPSGRDFLIGARGELDIYRISTLFLWDRQGISPFNLDEILTETNFWNGLLGASVYATRHSRIRLLAGLSSVSSENYAVFGPTVGTTVRLGIPIVSIEGAMLYTPAGFRQFDGRIEAVVRVFIFEGRLGYRGRWIETEMTGSRPFVLPTGGFTTSLGLVF